MLKLIGRAICFGRPSDWISKKMLLANLKSHDIFDDTYKGLSARVSVLNYRMLRLLRFST